MLLKLVRVIGHRPKGCVATGAPNPVAEPELATLFSQVRENIDRYRLLLDEYPFRLVREERHDLRNGASARMLGLDTVAYESPETPPVSRGGRRLFGGRPAPSAALHVTAHVRGSCRHRVPCDPLLFDGRVPAVARRRRFSCRFPAGGSAAYAGSRGLGLPGCTAPGRTPGRVPAHAIQRSESAGHGAQRHGDLRDFVPFVPECWIRSRGARRCPYTDTTSPGSCERSPGAFSTRSSAITL